MHLLERVMRDRDTGQTGHLPLAVSEDIKTLMEYNEHIGKQVWESTGQDRLETPHRPNGHWQIYWIQDLTPKSTSG